MSDNDVAQPLLATSAPTHARQPPSADTAVTREVLRKIDRTIIPLLFVTYIFNFMDKIILSSAAVFGLREDTVSTVPIFVSVYLACEC